MIDLYLFLILLLGSGYYLWSVYSYNKELELDEEDKRIAEVLLPIARIMNNVDTEAVAELFVDFNADLTPDEFIIVVRRHAWKNGIKVCKKETELCYRLIRELPLTEEQEELLLKVEHLLEQIQSSTEGLIINSQVCDK